jgi:hypothetical protein
MQIESSEKMFTVSPQARGENRGSKDQEYLLVQKENPDIGSQVISFEQYNLDDSDFPVAKHDDSSLLQFESLIESRGSDKQLSSSSFSPFNFKAAADNPFDKRAN